MRLFKFSLFLVTIISAKISFGQVQLSSNDVFKEGEYKIIRTPFGSLNPGKGGENQSWDFSDLKESKKELISISAYKNDGTTKDANFTESIDGVIKDYYKKISTDIYTVTGNSEGGFQNLRFMKFPLSYGQKLTDSALNISYYTGKTAGYDSLDSVKITTRIFMKSEADAWGMLKIPNATFNTLRFKMNIGYNVEFEGKKGLQPYKEIPKTFIKDSFTYYQWYAPSKGYWVLNYYEKRYIKYSDIEPLPSAVSQKFPSDIKVLNPINAEMNVINTGTNQFNFILFDMTGKQVLSKIIGAKSEERVDVDFLNAGVYSLQVVNLETQIVYYKRLIK